MAITKTVIGRIHDVVSLGAWLENNLIPKYADSIEVDTETVPASPTCSIYKDGHIIAKFTGNTAGNTPSPLVSLYYNDDAVRSVSATSVSMSNSERAGFVCENAVAIMDKRTQTMTRYNGGVVFTLDNEGNTAVICCDGWINSSGDNPFTGRNKVYTCRHDELMLSAPGDFGWSYDTSHMCETTTMHPFVIRTNGADAAYTPNAFFCPTYQYDIASDLVIDGVHYLSFGPWAFKDE